jgi:uncharacterized protein (DUF2235 family)
MEGNKGKNIVVCLDGTGNEFKQENTNVVKLFRVLERDPQKQIAYYDPGVGTLADPSYKTPIAKKINKALGLGFGRGITKNIEQAYSYLMENYEEGDRIYLFGFSRGAYTARALAGFIHACGLLDKGCQNLIPYAMKLYKARKPDFEILQKFKSTYGRICKIHFLGIWDSVSTIGWIYDPVFLPYTTNNKSVAIVRHAIAIDERRAFYRQLHWGNGQQAEQDVMEVWFAGVHSDIGGGYPESESGLAKITLAWMLEQAGNVDHGLYVNDKKYNRYVLGNAKDKKYIGPDYKADVHQSLKGAWRIVQHLPQRIWLPTEKRKAIRFPEQHRPILKGAILHQTVIDKINTGKYKPENLGILSEDELRKNYMIK